MTANFAEWVSTRAYIPRNLIVLVTGYNEDMPLQLRAGIQEIFERHLRKLKGFDSSKHAAYNEGKYQLIETTQLPEIEIVERFGKPIQAIFEKWIADHVAGKSQEELRENGVNLMIIEPDVTHTKAVSAWTIKGVVPTNTGAYDSSRDIAAAKEVVVYNISLDGHIEYGTPVILEEAQKHLDAINTINANPYVGQRAELDTYELFFEPNMSLWSFAKMKIKRWVNAHL